MSDQFPATERVYFDAPEAPQPVDSWWARYVVELTGLTPTARAVLEADCRFILHEGILGAGAPGPQSWQATKVRTGLVMGSVQSGKTASMLGVTGLALDHGADIVVVLAGTRLSLWRQTYERLTSQLDPGPDGPAKSARRLLCPAPGIALSDEPVALQNTYAMTSAAVRRKLRLGRPLIVVAMKQSNHLHALGAALRRDVFGAIENLDRPVHMLVLDDEVDDGSILDADVESTQDPVLGNLKQIPRGIANLWDPPSGAPECLFTTYIGYTATPQANLLQQDHNPLAPRDFLVALRTPLDIGHPVDPTDPNGNASAPRSSTYPDPAGMDAYYTGGEVFYRRGAPADLCVPTIGKSDGDLAEAVRAFLVAGAIRLHRSGGIGPHAAISASFDSWGEAAEVTAAPHSMLYHPSASIQDHFRAAEDVLVWAGVQDRGTARAMLESGEARLPASLTSSLHADPSPWSVWLDRYLASAQQIQTEFNLLNPNPIPDWSTVRDLLENEVIPGTRVAVVNSDPFADDRPVYRPMFDEATGRWRSARDLSTIFVSGNVMARGLTLEGMTTALFQRMSTTPLADTQMQMQRWFGYRGSYIELCRVFADQAQLDLFGAYHDIDEAVRVAISEKMVGAAPDPAVLQGLAFLATGKIANLRNRPLSPGPKPFVSMVNSGAGPDPNVQLVSDLFEHGDSDDLVAGGLLRGRILYTPLSLSDAAALLDRLSYEHYRPGSDDDVALLWSQVEARLAAEQPLASPGLYRPPAPHGASSQAHRACPHAIAAYLRLWEACLTRRVRGLFVTGQPRELWSVADLRRKQQLSPKFWVGIRYGGGAEVDSGPLAELSFRVPTTSKRVSARVVETEWGSNDPTAGPNQYRGDEFFDYYHRNEPVPVLQRDSSWRPVGSDGQILFYINQLPEQHHPAVALGVCVPAGGPEQFAATHAGVVQT